MRAVAPAVVIAVMLVIAGGAAHAAVLQVRSEGFLLAITVDIAAEPPKVWAALGQPGKWWNGAHTYSGDAANLSLPLEAGACFCERWPAGSVEHARVVFAKKDEVLRLSGALGPLQGLAVSGVVTFALTKTLTGSRLEVGHRVGGDPTSGLDAIAAPADQMLADQVARLKKFVESEKPE